MKFYVSLFSLFLAQLLSFQAFAGSPFTDLSSLKKSLGFSKYYPVENKGRVLRVAVLDKGFYGFEKEIGRTLPQDTRYVAGPVSNPEGLKVEHGLKMAQILTAFLTDDMQTLQWEPELTLYNVFGYSNFKSAVDDVIAKKVDLVLYSEVWEYGGNFDGTGFINEQINRATNKGVIWVNAAGNFGKTTYNGSIETLKEDWVKLPDQNNALKITCEADRNAKCPLKVVLSWNDFKNDVNLGTDKDLDLALTDDLLNIIQSSALKQTTDEADKPGSSKYPREIIQTEISKGTYYLRVKDRSQNFGKRDRLRITIDGENITMPSHSKDESLLNPADNSTVITVGASDSDRSSISKRLQKPDLSAPSSIKLHDGTEYRGSSNSAAIVAAGLAILKANSPKLTRKDLLKKVLRHRAPHSPDQDDEWSQPGLPLQMLGFGPTGAGCFAQAPLELSYVQDVVQRGGLPVFTTASVRIMVPFDPTILASNLNRQMINDMIVALPQGGYAVFPRYGYIPEGAVEIFQRPQEAGPCATSGNTSRGGTFYLP